MRELLYYHYITTYVTRKKTGLPVTELIEQLKLFGTVNSMSQSLRGLYR